MNFIQTLLVIGASLLIGIIIGQTFLYVNASSNEEIYQTAIEKLEWYDSVYPNSTIQGLVDHIKMKKSRAMSLIVIGRTMVCGGILKHEPINISEEDLECFISKT